MKYLGFEKRVVNEKRYDEKRIADIYIFNNPRIKRYSTGYTAVRPVNNNYQYFQIINDVLQKKNGDGYISISVKKNCLVKLDKKNFKDLSKKMGIGQEHLDSIVSGLA